MRRTLFAVLALLVGLAPAQAAGLLIPEEKNLPPLAMLNHSVTISIEDQVAVTRVEQTFRNHTSRDLEATYVFPVPKGASVDKFTMWVDGKETKAEVVEAKKAQEIYASIVRRTQDPGLLEYVGADLVRMRVYPVPKKGDQKVSVRFTSVAPKEGKLVEYVYPLKTDGKAVETLEKFSVTATIKSQHSVLNVYSPSHGISMKRISDKEVKVSFDKDQGALDRDFQLFYSMGKDDLGLTILTHRPISAEKGFFTLLIDPRHSMGEKYRIPQDMVLVMDTSGSMRGTKMEQARKALKYCLEQLDKSDRFGLIRFATTVEPYEEKLLDCSGEQIKKAVKWVDDLDATGGTAIQPALEAALKMRSKDTDRPFTIVFFTDGQPTFGETNPDKIFENVSKKNTDNARIFTFGVGDDVNAALLDKLASSTRALSAYVRPEEDIEHKVSTLYGKMSNPILTNLKLSTTSDVKFSEVYPVDLPDLFHGGQLVVMGRYSGKGASAITLTGKVGKDEKQFVYEHTFPDKTDDGREFVEQLWARRKVGALLDQIRLSGENKELVDEVTSLAKKYGITTPYTSYLIVPDGPAPDSNKGGGKDKGKGEPVARVQPVPSSLGGGGKSPPKQVLELAKKGEDRGKQRGFHMDKELAENAKKEGKDKDAKSEEKTYSRALDQKNAYDDARKRFGKGDKEGVQSGKLGVELAVNTCNLRTQSRMDRVAVRNVYGRQCLEVDGVWIDEAFTPKTEAVVVKAQSDAYFLLLGKHPELKKVFALGNYLVWVAPSGKALVIDANHGKEKLSDSEIKELFTAKKK